MNVIVVDDERIILAVETAQVIKVLPNANVASFLSAEEALSYAAAHRIDIAFLDINLEEITGLEMAKELQKRNPQVNVIFCTGYSEYALEAFELYSSGYLLKPVTEEKLRSAMSRLRYPIPEEKKRVLVKCFGNFELTVDEMHVKFKYSRTKELFAYLIDRRGASVSTNEIMAALFDSDDKSSYIRNLKSDLKATFQPLGLENLVIDERGKVSLNTELVDCDYFAYLDGEKNLFHGEYMSQYSFAESTLANLLNETSL